MTINSALRRKLKTLSITASLSFLVISFQNFTKLDFSDHPELSKLQNERVSLLFHKNHIKDDTNLDVIFFIDNESLTKKQIETLKLGLLDFINKIEKRTQLNLALFSNKSSKNNIKFPESFLSKEYLEFNYKGGISNFLDSSVKAMPDLIKKEFLRENSKKVFILVGNDDFKSTKGSITNEEFLKRLGSYIDLDQLTMYSIVGINSRLSPCSTMSGDRVVDLSKNLRGDVFNVCEQNWVGHFQSISNSVDKLTKTTFTLPHLTSQKIQVRVDGVNTDNYILEGNTIVLSPTHFNEEKSYIIQVDYLSKTLSLNQ